jgi:hypothetical protein
VAFGAGPRDKSPRGALRIVIIKVMGEVDAPRWNHIASLRGGQQREVRMRLSALETALLTACVVLAVVVAYWGLKILTA